jgi:hypothetical protein
MVSLTRPQAFDGSRLTDPTTRVRRAPINTSPQMAQFPAWRRCAASLTPNERFLAGPWFVGIARRAVVHVTWVRLAGNTLQERRQAD